MGMQSLALDRISALITWPNHPQPQASAHKKMDDKWSTRETARLYSSQCLQKKKNDTLLCFCDYVGRVH